MDGQGEVGDEFTSCDEDDDGDGPEWIHVSMISVELHGVRTFGGKKRTCRDHRRLTK